LLLNSSRDMATGLGNRNDLVGRYFMSHVAARGLGTVTLAGPRTKSVTEAILDPKFSCIRIKEDVQRRLGLLNHGAVLTRTSEAGLLRGTRRFIRLNRHFAKYFSGVDDGETFRLGSLAEQSPNYDNRVSPGTEMDYTGMKGIKLDFRINDIDRESIGSSLRFLASELGRLALGQVRLDFEGTSDLPFEPGEHHMGTTRMHRDLEAGCGE